MGPGDEVISTPYTMVATNTAILEQFAIPVFTDIKYESINIDPNDLEHRITEKTKAIMCVHWGGYPCDMDEIQKIASDHDIPVIEDAYKKKTILFYLEEIHKKIPKIKKLEEKIKRSDKKSDLSATFSTAINDVSLPDMLTIIKEQQIKPYQKTILKKTIENISKLDIKNVIDLLDKKNLSNEGIALSVLAVIEPIDYNMAEGNIFYKDFGIVFWSTSEMLKKKVEQGSKSFFNEVTKQILINVELDEIISRLKELSVEERSDYEYMFEIIQNFLNIITFSTQDGRIIHTLAFSTKIEKVELFWFYFGTQDFDIDEVIRKHNEKREYLIKKGSSKLKNSYAIIASEI